MRARGRTSAADTQQDLVAFARPRCATAVNAAAMENGQAPVEITNAIDNGSIAKVESWLAGGGDPNAMCSGSYHEWSLLRWAAIRGRAEIMSLLLSRGAEIDATDPEGRTALYQLLNYWTMHKSLPALRLLLSNGADVNLAIRQGNRGLSGRSPIFHAAGEARADCVRMLLRAGADPEDRDGDNRTAEERARSASHGPGPGSVNADFLRDVRLAGGWVRYALQPHYDLLVFRALCHCGRTTFSARTPEVLVRLFGAPGGPRRNNAVRGPADLPDPLFWRVLEFALGTVYDYPWVRQRVRARAAAS